MTFEEIKAKARQLTHEERLDLLAFIEQLDLQDDPEHAKEMQRRMAEMDAGKKFTLQDLQRLSEEQLVPAK